jgi:hypothetical protein
MRLTVGPLPPAVYWRRRLAILGALLLVVVVFLYACSGGDGGKNGGKGGGQNGTQSGSQPARPGRTPSPSPGPSGSAPPSALPPLGSLPPEGGEPVDQGAASPGADGSLAPAGASGLCTDEEMVVTAVPQAPSVARGAYVNFTLKIKNNSNRTCTRDVGADAQELFLLDASKAKMWSSDACDAQHGGDVRTFRPGIEAQFFVTWDGKATSSGCAGRPLPAAGRYQLVGRLSGKLSEPVPLEVK